jgi:hypothetical protein
MSERSRKEPGTMRGGGPFEVSHARFAQDAKAQRSEG